MDLTSLIASAEQAGCRVIPDASMAAATTFRVGGPADVLIDIPTPEAAAAVLAACHRENIPFFWLGNGSNLVVGDRGIRGAVLRLEGRCTQPVLQPELGEGVLYAPAGMSLQRLCLFARDNGLTGLEFAYGIPGTVGGAVYMNAGAYDGCMADVVQFAYLLTHDGQAGMLPAAELDMAYRHTALMDSGHIVTGICMRGIDESYIIGKLRQGCKNRLGITREPYIHSHIVAAIVPCIIWNQKQRRIHYSPLGGQRRSLKPDGSDALHDAIFKGSHRGRGLCILDDIHICSMLVIRLFRAIKKRSSGHAHTIDVGFYALVGNRVTHRHLELELHLVAGLPSSVHREEAVLHLSTYSASVNLH
jgi:UDP-N-acetylenolpyruvoylglucosamine reductase